MAHFALGRVHIFAGETEMAIGEMQIAIAINPNFALGHQGLGWATTMAPAKRSKPSHIWMLRFGSARAIPCAG